jgi:hypothetical protein
VFDLMQRLHLLNSLWSVVAANRSFDTGQPVRTADVLTF